MKNRISIMQLLHLYGLSRDLAHYTNINSASLNTYTHEVISVGSWMLGLDAKYIDERRPCCSIMVELNAIDRLSPQAWGALGNCYSLQKDHETALKTFQWAIQLDSHFTYAHTLCGHEYVAMEEFENGITCYRSALRIDPRHYNAWEATTYNIAVKSTISGSDPTVCCITNRTNFRRDGTPAVDLLTVRQMKIDGEDVLWGGATQDLSPYHSSPRSDVM